MHTSRPSSPGTVVASRSVHSPLSMRDRSCTSPTSDASRSHSSSITARKRSRGAAALSRLPASVSAYALMDDSGLRSSCATIAMSEAVASFAMCSRRSAAALRARSSFSACVSPTRSSASASASASDRANSRSGELNARGTPNASSRKP